MDYHYINNRKLILGNREMEKENKIDFFLKREDNIKPMLLAEHISKIVTDAILEGELKDGQKLVEAELQKKFRTSKSPIREALRDLEKKGLVIIKPRRGTRVRKISHKDISEIFPVRAALEGLAASEAYEKMSKDDVLKMESIFLKMKDLIRKDKIKEYREYHFKFHQIFINASNNELLKDILCRIRTNILWYRFSYKYFKEDYKYSIEIHKKILDLFKNRDKSAAVAENLIRDHIMHGYKKFIKYLKNQED